MRGRSESQNAMARPVHVALVACLLLAGCAGFGGSPADCTTTPSPTPRAQPPVLVEIENEEPRTRSVGIRVTHLNGSRTVLFDSSVSLAPVKRIQTRATFPSREGRYRVRATAGNATGRATLTVPEGRLRHVRVRITVNGTDAGSRVTVRSTARTPTPAC
jgi:hypothetical protein